MTKPKKITDTLDVSQLLPDVWENAIKQRLERDLKMFKDMYPNGFPKPKPLTKKQKADLEFKSKLSSRLNALDKLLHDIAAEYGVSLDTDYDSDFDD